jgi:hypothetical protein
MIDVAIQRPWVRQFEPEDAFKVQNRDGDQSSVDVVLAQAAGGPAFTAVLGEQPIALGGIVIPWPGMGMCWMALSDEAEPYMAWLSITTRRFMLAAVKDYSLHRVEAVALQGSAKNQQWLEWLGFTREVNGVAQAYLTDKRNMIRYEWIGG